MNSSHVAVNGKPNLSFSAQELAALKPIVIADFMRPLPGQKQAKSGMQNNITRNLFNWLEPALLATFSKSLNIGIWDDLVEHSMPVAQIYQEYDVDPSTSGWIQLYRAKPTKGLIDILRPFFEGHFVIGFELSPLQTVAFDMLGIPYVSLAIHPLRFMQDYKFMINSNIGDFQPLLPFSDTRDQIYFAAQLRRAELRGKIQLDLAADSAILFGQVEIDAALIGPRGVISLHDHLGEVSELCKRYENVYFKPHPYGGNGKEQARILAQFNNLHFVSHNPYALLAAPQIEVVAALTSSILTEAHFFGKKAHALSKIWQDRSNEPAYGISLLSSEFWKTLLACADKKKVLDQVISPPKVLTDITIKSLLNVSWETHGASPFSDSGISIILDKSMMFGIDQDADGMRRGKGWKSPSAELCWSGPTNSYLSFRLPPNATSNLLAEITLNGMAKKENPVLLKVFCQDQVLHERVIDSAGVIKFKIPLLERHNSALGDVLLEFVCSHGHSPHFIGGGPDRRDLSFALREIKVSSPKNALSFYVGERVDARDTLDNTRFMPYGWHRAEEHGIWTNGRRSRLRVTTHPIPEEDLELTLGSVSALLSDMVPVNTLIVSVNGVPCHTRQFKRGQPGDMSAGGVDITVPLPREVFCKSDSIAIIDFEIVACHSPQRAGFSSDTRELGLMIGYFSFNSAIRAIAEKPPEHIANIFGPFNIQTGLAVMARNSFLAIESAMDHPSPENKKLLHSLKGPRAINFNNSNHLDKDSGFVQYNANGSNINIFCGDVTRVSRIVKGNGNSILNNRYNVCYGAWELETLPSYLADTRYIEEYWGLSTFIADAARKRINVPVYAFPIPVALHFPDVLTPRARFGIPENVFAFLFTFSVDSTMSRKNPKAVLDAFQIAFPDPEESIVMVFKSMIKQASTQNREAFNKFKAEARKDPRVILVEETLDQDENASLYMRCDAYISLHRAEGFGLTMAEAMGYGKPTIATGYSGNLDFMNNNNSCLVKFKKVKMDSSLYHGQQQEWAEPDVADAASHMRRVVDDVRFREKIARAGKRKISEEFSNHAVGQKLLTRLQEIRKDRS
jgi:glycosyltransferase involved in cell wall biosynthesis